MDGTPDSAAPAKAKRIPDSLLALFSPGDRHFAAELLGSVLRAREETIDRAHELYARSFADARILAEGEFRRCFGSILDALDGLHRSGAAEEFLSCARQLGEQLASRGVQFSEFVVALYFFEEACFAAEGAPGAPRAQRAFDRLCHQLIAAASTGFVARRLGEGEAVRSALERDVRSLAPSTRSIFHGLVGRSPAMRRLFARLSAAAQRHSTVLLIGETGTGKELCARAVHDLSDRSRGPFVPVNCAAIPREILASELFGHRRGAFTGAVADSKGLISAAEGGTLFLDEVTEMGESAQVALLRVLEQHAIRPIGTTGERPIDVRFVAAANKRPEEAVASGSLRADLYHRIAATTIEVPPLRERMEDLPLLVEYFLERFAAAEGMRVPVLSDEARASLASFDWPGNVRELANCLESAATFSRDDRIELADLPERILKPGVPPPKPEIATVRDHELALIRSALDRHRGNKAAAARSLGISRKRLYAKLREMGDAPS